MRMLLALCLLGGVTRAVEWDAVQEALARPVVDLAPGVVIRRVEEAEKKGSLAENEEGGSVAEDEEGRLLDDVEGYARSHALEVRLPIVGKAVGRVLDDPRFSFGKNSFLTGFGLGFLAFGLKKLLLPLFIGAQIVKSILIAMFLPSILGGIGKLVGKGVTSVAHSSGAGHQPASETISDFDFKDNINHYDSEQAGSEGQFGVWSYPPATSSVMDTMPLRLPPSLPMPSALTSASNKNSYHERYPVKLGSKHQHGSFYSKDTQQDYRVFHNIPTSSHLLAHYDPFYSPLLSRLDSVFQQLATSREACRERLVCDMYKAPAKFAPYSNLVSAQLSRELNELRKPSSDNPEILRFFRYMKAAKDGQDGMDCQRVYKGCGQPSPALQASPMVATFNDINKLVQARHS